MKIVLEKDELNPKIFNNGRMKFDVRDAILDVVDEFCNQVDQSFNIIDIILVGSNAGYNYTEYSDLDIHLVVDFYEICKCCPDVVQHLFNSEKSRFNINYDISIKGIDVEIYVEDIRSSTVSNGIYSIMSDCWIKYPEYKVYSNIEIGPDYEDLMKEILYDIDIALSYPDNPGMIKSTIDRLYLIRKRGLETLGEVSSGNLVFKEIRNRGLLDKLKDAYYKSKSKELSLEGVNQMYSKHIKLNDSTGKYEVRSSGGLLYESFDTEDEAKEYVDNFLGVLFI